MSTTAARDQLRALAEELADADVDRVVRFARWLSGEDAEALDAADLAALDRGLAQAAAGETRDWRTVQRGHG